MTPIRRARAFVHLSAFVGCSLIAGLGSCSEAPPLPGAGDAAAQDARVDRTTPFTDVEDITCVTCRPEDAGQVIVPAGFAGRSNPLAGDETAIGRGRSFFQGRCALCHGPEGDGRGLEGPVDPPAADLRRGGRADDYLFWRITEGGSERPFCSSMPAYRALSETERWQIVAHVRTFARDASADAADADD